MKKLTFLTVAVITILITISVVDLSQTADAIKSKGNSLPETGSNKVCGDRLCSEVDSQRDMKRSDSMMQSSSVNIHAMMEKMNKLHESHQQQMLQYWNSLTMDEQAQMYQHMQEMVERMKSMDMHEHMQMMSSMGEKDHVRMHMDSDEEYETAEHLAIQHLKTFDELDFVFTNQKWNRLKESHSEDIIVHWPDGSNTKGIERHIEDLKAMFIYAPDTRIQEHTVRIASGEWTSVTGVMEGTFTEPMPLTDGTVIPPTGKAFRLQMVTVGHWNNDDG